MTNLIATLFVMTNFIANTNYLNENIVDIQWEYMGMATNCARTVVDDQVKELAKSGAICKVFGHMWRDGRPGESDIVRFADYRPNTQYRTCRICEKCESMTLEWK
jgi:hypothetical protein